jgi:hypothetical protein
MVISHIVITYYRMAVHGIGKGNEEKRSRHEVKAKSI